MPALDDHSDGDHLGLFPRGIVGLILAGVDETSESPGPSHCCSSQLSTCLYDFSPSYGYRKGSRLCIQCRVLEKASLYPAEFIPIRNRTTVVFASLEKTRNINTAGGGFGWTCRRQKDFDSQHVAPQLSGPARSARARRMRWRRRHRRSVLRRHCERMQWWR